MNIILDIKNIKDKTGYKNNKTFFSEYVTEYIKHSHIKTFSFLYRVRKNPSHLTLSFLSKFLFTFLIYIRENFQWNRLKSLGAYILAAETPPWIK